MWCQRCGFISCACICQACRKWQWVLRAPLGSFFAFNTSCEDARLHFVTLPPVVVSFIPFLMFEFDVRHGCMTSYINNAVKKQVNLSRDNFNDSLSTPKCTTCLLEERKRHHVGFLLQLLLLLLDKTWQELILFVLWWFASFWLLHRSVKTHWWSIGLHIILFCIFKTVLYKKQTLTTIIKMIHILFVECFSTPQRLLRHLKKFKHNRIKCSLET